MACAHLESSLLSALYGHCPECVAELNALDAVYTVEIDCHPGPLGGEERADVTLVHRGQVIATWSSPHAKDRPLFPCVGCRANPRRQSCLECTRAQRFLELSRTPAHKRRMQRSQRHQTEKEPDTAPIRDL